MSTATISKYFARNILRPDIIAASIFICSGAFGLVIVSKYGAGYGFPASLLVAGLGYLLARRFGYLLRIRRLRASTLPVGAMVAALIAILSISVSLVASVNSYGPPWWTFPLFAVAAVALAVQILSPGASSFRRASILLQLTFLSVAAPLSMVLAMPYVGGDALFHLDRLGALLATGDIGGLAPTGYEDHPLFYVASAGLSLLTGLSPYQSLVVIGTIVPSMAVPLLGFSLARYLLSEKAALFAILMLVVGKFHLFWMTSVSPMAVTFVPILLTAYLLLRGLSGRRPVYVLGASFTALWAVSLHPIGGGAVIITVVAFALGSRLTNLVERLNHVPRSKVANVIIAPIIIIAAYLVYLSVYFDDAAERVASLFAGLRGGQLGASYRPTLIYEVDQIGVYILLTLAAIGVLVWVRTRHNVRAWLPILIASGFFLIIAFAGYIRADAVQELFPHRWLAYGLVLAAIPAGLAIYQVMRNNWVGLTFGLAIVGALALTSMMATEVNTVAPWYGEQYTRPDFATNADLAAVKFADTVATGQIAMDVSLWPALQMVELDDGSRRGIRYEWAGSGGSGMVWIYRDISTSRPVWDGRPLDEGLAEKLDRKLVTIYDNGQASLVLTQD